jgi:diguanylate cyclase (GGDEF)-like protein
MHWKSQSGTALPQDTSALEFKLDSESFFANEIPSLNSASLHPVREVKRSFDESFQIQLSESNQELATLLREVHLLSDAALGRGAQNLQSNELLMRAIHCAVKQQKLQAELSSLALTDELTGLYNRRGFLYLTERQLKLASRSGRDMLLFFFDVDGLKRINDSFGHTEGDFALFRTAAVLGLTFRSSDVLARLGGDEFAALAIEASDHCETTIMARFRETLEALSAQEPRYRLSLSVGVVRFCSSSASSIEELMLQADQAMYRVKRKERTFSSSNTSSAHSASGTKQALTEMRREGESEMEGRDFR